MVLGLAVLMLMPLAAIAQPGDDSSQTASSPSSEMLSVAGTAINAANEPGAGLYGLRLRDEKRDPSLARRGWILSGTGLAVAAGGFAAAIYTSAGWMAWVGLGGTGAMIAGLINLDTYYRRRLVEIEHVSVGGAASRAGLEPGDRILKVNGDIIRTVAQLDAKLLLSQDRPGPLDFFLSRGGKRRHIVVENPAATPSQASGVQDAVERIGE
ncbi:MAG: PDZ domain-containing protein [Planctomycetes bacterium]|nr:PDZ domain-containing protein [Planctomycetota bacterium]